MKENWFSTMAGAAIWLILLTLMGWAAVPDRPTPTPSLIHMPSLALHTEQAVKKYTAQVTAEMVMRSKP